MYFPYYEKFSLYNKQWKTITNLEFLPNSTILIINQKTMYNGGTEV